MFVFLTFILLFLSILAVIILRLVRPGAPYIWLAMGGVSLAWLSVLLWQLNLPWRSPEHLGTLTLFNTAPQFSANSLSWIYALSLSALTAAVILTSPARNVPIATTSWPETLVLAGLGLLTVLADNPLGLALAWMSIDLAEFTIALREHPSLGESVWLTFALRLSATGAVLWANVVGVSSIGQAFSLETAPSQAGVLLLTAAGLRLSALPLSFAYHPEQYTLRRGFGTILCMVSAVTGLTVLARTPVTEIDPNWVLPLFGLIAVAALYGGLRWFLAHDELQGRPYWLIGMSALSLTACLSGNPSGSVAWGVALILFGGISMLYSAKQIWLTRVLTTMGLFTLSIPFTLTASGWQTDLPLPFLFWPLFVIAHAMLIAGYIRHLLNPAETALVQLPNWAQVTYPLGLGLIIATILLGSIWGWPGAFLFGTWGTAIAALFLSGVFFFLSRLPFIASLAVIVNRPSRLDVVLRISAQGLSFFYQLIGEVILYISALLEGDGGLLWTLLLLILLISFLRER